MSIDNMHPASGRVVKENEEIINFADLVASVHDTDQIITGDLNARQFRAGKVYGAGHMWANLANDAYAALHIKTGAKKGPA